MSGSCAPRTRSFDPVPPLKRASGIVVVIVVVLATFALQMVASHTRRTRKTNKVQRTKLIKRLGVSGQHRDWTILGFFHPYCNAGGGGERVLWHAIKHHLDADESIIAVVYTGDVGPELSLDVPLGKLKSAAPEDGQDGVGQAETTKRDILEKCRSRFDIPLDETRYMSRIHLLPLRSRHLVSDTYWTRLTLLGQSWGSVVLGWEACNQLLPDVWLDTMGYAFTYPLVRLFAPSMPIGAYVHYPTISTDMLNRVRDRQAGHTNDAAVSSSAAKSTIKLIYYRLFAAVYAWSLRRADVLVANGSWTCNHLRQLLGRRSPEAQPQVVYPPCDTASLTGFPLVPRKRLTIVSLAQFRPEKEHGSQLRAVGLAIEKRPSLRKDLRLVCMGSCRNEADEKRIQDLKQLAKDLKIDDLVSFVVNAPYSTIVENLSQASIGISTMVDEHFGINVVEFMAAGLITLSHASAGPLLDIAVEVDGKPTGLHAHTLQDFAEAILKIADMDAAEDEAMRSRARRRAIETFSGAAFENAWQERLASRLMAPRKDKST